MKKALSLLFAPLLFVACSQEPQEKIPARTTQLHISADLVGDAPRAMDYSLQGTKLKVSLEGKKVIPVHTYIYQGGSLVYVECLQWQVREDKKGIYYNAPINYTADDTGKPLKLVAIIADGTGFGPKDHRLDMSAVVSIISSDTPAQLNVPYVLETDLGRDVSGFFQARTATPRIFKPQGILLRCTVVNNSKHSITIDRIASTDLIPQTASLNSVDKTFRRTEHASPQVISLPRKLTVAAGKRSAEQILVWLPSIPSEFKLEALASGADAMLISSRTKLSHRKTYESGKVYKADLDLYRRASIPNPLALLSEDVVNTGAKNFVDLRNSFSLDDLETYNGPGKVGYFTATQAEAQFKTSRSFPVTSSEKWHLPSKYEWNAILYTPRNVTKYEGTISGDVAVQSGDGYKKTVSYTTYVPSGYSRTEGGVFYVLSFGQATGGSKEGYPVETTDDNRLAFRYDVRQDRIILTCVHVGDDPKITSAASLVLSRDDIFSRADAVTRILPFYGISNNSSGENKKDNTGGNRTIVDYRATGKWIGAFSIAHNAVLESDALADAWLPIALFRDAD